MRSPAALAASLFCLASAMLLAGLLVEDDAEAEPVQDHDDAVALQGTLTSYQVPEGWVEVRQALDGSTYRLRTGASSDLVLLTGLTPDLDGDAIHADATKVLETTHPDDPAARIVVFRVVDDSLPW